MRNLQQGYTGCLHYGRHDKLRMRVRVLFASATVGARQLKVKSESGKLAPMSETESSLSRFTATTRTSVVCDDNAKLALFATTGALAPQRSVL